MNFFADGTLSPGRSVLDRVEAACRRGRYTVSRRSANQMTDVSADDDAVGS